MLIATPIASKKWSAYPLWHHNKEHSQRTATRRYCVSWNDASWCEHDLARAIGTMIEQICLLSVRIAPGPFVAVKGCEEITILGAGCSSRKEPQKTASDVTGTRCGNMAFSVGVANLHRSPITQGDFRLLSIRVNSSICQCRRAL